MPAAVATVASRRLLPRIGVIENSLASGGIKAANEPDTEAAGNDIVLWGKAALGSSCLIWRLPSGAARQVWPKCNADCRRPSPWMLMMAKRDGLRC